MLDSFVLAAVIAFLAIVLWPRWIKTGAVLVALGCFTFAMGQQMALFGLTIGVAGIVSLVIGIVRRRKRAHALVQEGSAEEAEEVVEEQVEEPEAETEIASMDSATSCPSCQSPTDPGAAFCSACGAKLTTGSDSPMGSEHGGAEVDNLRSAVLTVISEQLGLNDLTFGDDGFLRLIVGSSAVALRLETDPLRVHFAAPIVHEVPPSTELWSELNSLNGSLSIIGRICWIDEVIQYSSEVLAEPFVEEHFMRALQLAIKVSDDLDEELQGRFGGKLTSEVISLPEDKPA